MSTEYLSKEEVAKRMRELADNVKNNDLAVEIKELADRVEKEGDADFLGENEIENVARFYRWTSDRHLSADL